MAYGLQVFDSSGTLITEVTDRLTVLFSQGRVTPSMAPNYTFPPIVVSVPGVTADDNVWFCACTNGATATVGNGTVTIYPGEVSDPINFSVFRR